MTQGAETTTGVIGRPRSERSRRAIITAAGELLEEQGLRAMTVEGVARRAGVSKKTISAGGRTRAFWRSTPSATGRARRRS